MKLGFLYAGQGSQFVEMGLDFYNEYDEFKKIIDEIEIDFNLKELMFNGPKEELNITRYTQPIMVAFALGITKLLKEEGIKPKMVAGLSLGEYSALYGAEVLNAKDVIDLVNFRGKAMTEASKGLEVGMSAVLGLGKEAVMEACEKAKSITNLIVEAVNFNCPGQIVISGDKVAVEKASELLKESGAKRCLPLAVSGPFHTIYMEPASKKLEEKFKDIKFNIEALKDTEVVFNTIGRGKNQDETVEDLLKKQVMSSVLFEDSIRYMEQQGIDTIIEIGPGKVLSGFVKKTTQNIKFYNIEKVEDYKKVIEEIKK